MTRELGVQPAASTRVPQVGAAAPAQAGAGYPNAQGRVGEPPLGTEPNPHAPMTMDDFAKVPLGNWFRNPADGRVLQKHSEPPAASASPETAPLDPALNPGNE